MRQGAILSALFHLAILAAVIIGLPSTSNPFEIGNPKAVPIVFADAPIDRVTNQVEGTSQPAEPVEVPAPPDKPEPPQMAALEPPVEEAPQEPPPPQPAEKDVPPPPTPEPVAQPTPEPEPIPEPAAEPRARSHQPGA